MHRLFFIILAALAFMLGAAPAFAITIAESSRSVIVSTFIDASGVTTDSSLDGFESTELGSFLEAIVDGIGFGDVTVANGEALQESTIEQRADGSLFIDGGGSAGVVFDVQDPGFPSRATGNADSQLSILFDTDQAQAVDLAVSLSANLDQLSVFPSTGSAGASADVRSIARLTGASSGIVFEAEVADTTAGDGVEVDDFLLSGILLPDTYLFEILAVADLRGFENAAGFATSGFGVRLHVIPEPGTAMMIGLGLILLSGRRTSGHARGEVRTRTWR